MSFYWRTSHWNLSSYLVYLEYELIDVEPIPAKPHLLEFTFADPEKTAKADTDRFFSPEGVKVDARRVLEAGAILRRAGKEARARLEDI